MKMIKQMAAWIRKRAQIVVWILAALCGILFLVSRLFPKYAYQITEYHVVETEDENEIWIELTPDTVVSYRLQVGERSLCGVNLCFDWGRETYPAGNLVLEAWNADAIIENTDIPGTSDTEAGSYPEDARLGSVVFGLNSNLRMAYSYAELTRGEELTGNLLLTLHYESAESEPADYPYVIATDKRMENSRTFINGVELSGDLLMYHVALRASYPLVFDARMFFLLFLAVGFTMAGKEQKVTKEKGLAL